jgi:FKBP-type peptidyl-prolyl cis-trans isomerase
MKQTIWWGAIAAAALALIVGGIWYNKAQDARTAVELQAAQERSAQEQKTIMDNFKITDIRPGTGPEAKAGDTLVVNYLGTLMDGKKFDSSYDRNQPFELKLGAGDVIQGWDLGLVGMKVGGKRELIIPPDLGYGPNPIGPIPPNSTLKFEIELLAIK